MASACNGCGVCIEACRTVNDLGAIRLVADDKKKAVHRTRA
jgi:ferredoxin